MRRLTGGGTASTSATTGAVHDPLAPPPRVATGLDIAHLVVRFGSVLAVDDVSLSAAAGRATALLGRNGAGKSTTLRVAAAVVPATQGRVRVAGVDVTDDPLGVKHLVGYCPDVGGLVPRATPWEHLELSARLRGLRGWEPRARDLLDRFDLLEAADRVTAGFSHGMGRRTSVVLAVLHQPQVLLLDEPFDGVDPTGADATLEVIAEARDRGATVVVSTHLRDLAVRACDDAVVMRDGRVAALLPASQLAGEEGERAYRELLT
ncbi:MAG: ABC transporter ATP-binding protein [Actinomycetota bacterium]|nr:ABC transporter ATP-binding protein [Actinomycetota bacterium]